MEVQWFALSLSQTAIVDETYEILFPLHAVFVPVCDKNKKKMETLWISFSFS